MGVSVASHAHALAEFAARVPLVETLEELIDEVVTVAGVALAADSVHVGRIDHPHGRLRMIRNAGRLADWEVASPDDESYLIADYPRVVEHC